MASNILSGTVNTTGYAPYVDDIIANDVLFNIYADARLALFGNSLFTGDKIALQGQLRNRGSLAIDDNLSLLNNSTFVNAENVTQNGTVLIGQSSDDAATIRNLHGATWSLGSDDKITGAGSSQFVNLGLLDQTGGVSNIGANFYDRGGTINIEGTMEIVLNSGPLFSNGYVGRFVNDRIEGSGTFKLYGGISFPEGTSSPGTESYGVLAGSNISVAEIDLYQVRAVGNVTVSSATANIDYLIFGSNSVFSLTNPSAQVRIETLKGVGTLEIKGNDNVVQSAILLLGNVTLANYGDTTFASVTNRGENPHGFALETEPWNGQINIVNEAGATWTVAPNTFQAHIVQNGGDGTSVFVNYGTFISGNGVEFGMDVVNSGTIEAGLDTYNGNISGVGTIELGGETVVLNGSVGDSQTVHFNPTTLPADLTPTLILDIPQEFRGLISGFDQGDATDDRIILNSLGNLPTWQYENFVANNSGTGGSLMFTNGSTEATVNLAGSFDPSKFHAAIAGSQTTITYG